MKNGKKRRRIRRIGKELLTFAVTFVLFFMFCAFVITCSFLLFFSSIDLQEEQVRAAAGSTFFNALLLTFLFVLVDMIRRHFMVDRPVRKIQEALDKVQRGDFSFRLDTGHASVNFKEIMESINRMAEELSGLETLRTDFVSNVSHELKTPLAIISNYATLLNDAELSEEDRQTYTKAIKDTSVRISDLVSNILRLNRLENQQIYPETTSYHLTEQLCECLLGFESVWEDKNIELVTDMEEDVIITADAELLAIVWNNLLSNAFKFTPDGGTVSVSVRSDGDFAVVSVEDTGCGMSPEVGKHIFEKFYQGDTSRATMGNGLGLALVRRIMDIMGGEISVNSTLGEGSVFTVRLRRYTHESSVI